MTTPTFTPDQIDFVVSHIAGKGLAPATQNKPWAGESATIEAARVRFPDLDIQQARELVAAAVEHLFDDRLDSPPRVERRLMVHRSNDLRILLDAAVRTPKITTEYAIHPVLDADNKPVLDEAGEPKFTKTPTKVTEVNRTDPALAKLLIEVDRDLYRLHNLEEDKETGNLTRQLLEQLEKAGANPRGRDSKVTINQFIQNVNLDHLPAPTRKLLQEAAQAERERAPAAASELPGALIDPAPADDVRTRNGKPKT